MQRLVSKYKAILLFVVAAIIAFTVPFGVVVYPTAAAEEASQKLVVHILDVKQGDCVIIELPDGKNMIVDAGSGTSEDANVTGSVLEYIQDTFGSEFKYFDYAVLTHAHSDHSNALDDVLKKYPSYVCYRPNVEADYGDFDDPGKADLSAGAKTNSTATYKRVIENMYKKIEGTDSIVYVTDPAVDSQDISGGAGEDAYTFRFFSPLEKSYSDANDYSPIMLLEYRGFKFALSGDAAGDNESQFVKKVNDAKTDGVTDKYDIFDDSFNVDVFKVGHHGSESSSSQAYLDVMTSPTGAKDSYYVFSCNYQGNKYWHPRQVILDRVVALGGVNDKMLRTDHYGNIVFTVSDSGSGYALTHTTQINYTGTNLIGADVEFRDGGASSGGSGGSGGSVTPPSGSNKEPEKPFWDSLTKTQKILIIVAIVVVAIIVLIIVVRFVRHGGLEKMAAEAEKSSAKKGKSSKSTAKKSGSRSGGSGKGSRKK